MNIVEYNVSVYIYTYIFVFTFELISNFFCLTSKVRMSNHLYSLINVASIICQITDDRKSNSAMKYVCCEAHKYNVITS